MKGMVVYSTLAILFSSCFNPPELSNIPQIEFESITFKSINSTDIKDTLILTINFKDGDGDLGLEKDLTDYPFNAINFYLGDIDGNTQPVGSFSIDLQTSNSAVQILSPVIQLPAAVRPDAKLISASTRSQLYYDTLPSYPSEYPCANYAYRLDSVYVLENNASIFEGTYTPAKIIEATPQDIYVLYDYFYFKKNPLHYNIKVQFFIINNDESETEFDWEKELCVGFDGRFPVLFEGDSKPLEGTITYKMTGKGFLPLLGGRTIRLRVQVTDKALNKSNVVESGPFLFP